MVAVRPGTGATRELAGVKGPEEGLKTTVGSGGTVEGRHKATGND